MQPPDHSFSRQKQGQGFGIPKALKKLFREPGPLRTTDVRGRNVSLDISSPNMSYPLPPMQQFQSNFSSPFDYGNHQPEYYNTLANMTSIQPASDTFDISMPPHQVQFPDAFPSRVSFDHFPINHAVEDDPSQGWTKKVFQPFARARKFKNSIPSGQNVEKEANYPIVFHRDLEYGYMPQADINRKPSLVKRKPVPSYGGSSLDSQLVPQFSRNRDRQNQDFRRDPYSRYSVGELVRSDQPQAVYMNQPPSSGFQEGSSAMPKESALGLDLGDYSLMNAASFPSPYVADGKNVHKDFDPLPSSEWSSDTVDQAATPKMPSMRSEKNVIPSQYDNLAIKNEQSSLIESAPTGSKIKVAKEYADKKFGEWVSRTSNVPPNSGSHNPSNRKNESEKFGHERIKTMKQSKSERAKGDENMNNHDGKESRRISSKTPVDPFELDMRLSNLTACSPRNSALKRTSHQRRSKDKVSNPNLSRNLAAKMMNEAPGKSIMGQSGTVLPDIDQPSITARAQDDQRSGNLTPKNNVLVNKMKADAICEPEKHALHTLSHSPIKVNEAYTTDKREEIMDLSSPDHKNVQPRHWRSTEVLYQNTRIEDTRKPFEADRQHDGNEAEMNSSMGDVEPVTISSEELELLNRVQTWRSCVSITPMRKLYAPSASATEPSTMTGIDQVQTGADERASEWTSISRRVDRGVQMEGSVPMLRSIPYDLLPNFDEFNDRRASKSYQMPETRTSMRFMPMHGRSLNEEAGDGPGNISLHGPSSELIKFLVSLHLPPAQKVQQNLNDAPAKEELLIDLNPSEIDRQSQKLQFGTQHIRQMSEADSKRLFDLIDDKIGHQPQGEKSEKINESSKTKKTRTNKTRFVTNDEMHQTNNQTKEHEAKVWDLLHKTDKDGLTAMERLLNAYAEELGTFAQGNDRSRAPLPHAVPQQDPGMNERKQNTPSTKKKSKEVCKPSTSYNTSKTKVDEEKAENVLQSIFEYVQGAGEVSQIHSTLISMHKDLLDRTKDPGKRKSIDDRLIKLEQAVFAKYEK